MGTRQLFSSLHNGRFQLDHGREMTGAETNTGIQKAKQTHMQTTP